MKRLQKSKTDKVLDGVCGGIAEYFQVDAVIIRIIWVLATIFLGAGFMGVIAYLIAMVIIPSEPVKEEDSSVEKEENPIEAPLPQRKEKTWGLIGILFIVIGSTLFIDRMLEISLWNWFFNLFASIKVYAWPLLLIILGIFLLRRKKG